MAEMLSGVAAGTVALVLLMAFAGHLMEPGGLPAALAAHRTLPGFLVWPVGITVGALEGLFGAALGYALLTGRPHTLVLAATGCALLFAGYALYGLYLLRTRPDVPCGCAADDTPMSGWVTGRAAALALASATAAAGAGPATASQGAHVAVVALSSAVFAIAVWLVPLAMLDPERSAAR
jgi:Methylamine utilisation protein MauE